MRDFLRRTVEAAMENIAAAGGPAASTDEIADTIWQTGDTAVIVSAAKSCAAIEVALLAAETMGVWPFVHDRKTLLEWAYIIDPM